MGTASVLDAFRGMSREQIADVLDRLSPQDVAALEASLPPSKAEHVDAADPQQLACRMVAGWRTRPHLSLIAERFAHACQTGGRLIVNLPPQFGKALDLETPLPTPDGWTTMGNVQPGDQLLDERGRPCHVVAVSPVWQDRPCYEVRTDDGWTVIADEEHEWHANLDRRTADRLYTTKTIARARGKRALLRIHAPLDLPKRDLPIDPYVLGAWLGDGSTAGGAITSWDPPVLDEIRRAGYTVRPWADGRTFGILGLRVQLRALGVLGNKHIPPAYLRASPEQRLALLQGIVDTDGYVAPHGHAEVATVSRRLSDQIRELVVSLGRKCPVYEGRATIDGRDCGPKWRVCFYHAHAARMPRKATHARDAASKPHRYIDATKVEPRPTRCIEVDSPSHMFLAGRGMLPTHNSGLTSRWGPTWFLNRWPGRRVIMTSYSDHLVVDQSRQVRDLFAAGGLNTQVRKGAATQARWDTTAGGGMLAAGIAGSVTGYPAHLFVMDDPFKGWEEAHSKAARDRVWNFWRAVAVTRLAPGAAVVITTTRWHEDDIVGRLRSTEWEGDPDEWEVLSIPAISEGDGDPLDRPEGEPLYRPDEDHDLGGALAFLAGKRKDAGPYLWNGMFQQRPSEPEGTILRRAWWQFYRREGDDIVRPDGTRIAIDTLRIVQSWDMAFKDKTTSDYVVGQVWGALGRGDRFLLDQWRDRADYVATKNAMKKMRKRWPQTSATWIEDKANGPAIVSELKRELSGLVPDEPKGDKVQRAYGVQGDLEAGSIWIPAPGHATFDVQAFIQECADFPNGTNDDQVDAFTQAILRLRGGTTVVEQPKGDKSRQASGPLASRRINR